MIQLDNLLISKRTPAGTRSTHESLDYATAYFSIWNFDPKQQNEDTGVLNFLLRLKMKKLLYLTSLKAIRPCMQYIIETEFRMLTISFNSLFCVLTSSPISILS